MRNFVGVLALSVLTAGVSACAGPNSADSAGPAVTLNASGATFPQAFYEEAILDFTLLHPNVTINYAGGGSGKGRTDLQERQVDFAGSDGVVKQEDVAKYRGGEILYFPTISAPIAVAYNLDKVKDLRLSAETIARIFQREITVWNDPRLVAENPGVVMPKLPISVARRADGSGTTENFTKFLVAAALGVWTLQSGSTVQWPAGVLGAQGNAGVASLITGSKGTIGYVDYSDAKAAGLTFAAIGNAAGNYVQPSLESVSAALSGVMVNDDLTYNPINAPGAHSYPIAAPTWILVYKNQSDRLKGETIKAFLQYILTSGQHLATDVDYAPLNEELVAMALAQLDEIVLPAEVA